MYIRSIFLYLMWPAIILVSYWCIRWALKRFDKKLTDSVSEE